jgi:hypothetical protein
VYINKGEGPECGSQVPLKLPMQTFVTRYGSVDRFIFKVTLLKPITIAIKINEDNSKKSA